MTQDAVQYTQWTRRSTQNKSSWRLPNNTKVLQSHAQVDMDEPKQEHHSLHTEQLAGMVSQACVPAVLWSIRHRRPVKSTGTGRQFTCDNRCMTLPKWPGKEANVHRSIAWFHRVIHTVPFRLASASRELWGGRQRVAWRYANLGRTFAERTPWKQYSETLL